MLRSPDLYNKAIVLRRKGLSYNEILKFVPVGQGTISRWCSKIPLTEKQKERLLEKKRNTPLIRQLRKQAIQSKKEARIWVKEKISKLLNQNKDYILLISGIGALIPLGIKISPYYYSMNFLFKISSFRNHSCLFHSRSYLFTYNAFQKPKEINWRNVH